MKRFLFALMALAILATSASAQVFTFAEKVVPFRSTGLASGTVMPISTGQTLYADSSFTSRAGQAWVAAPSATNFANVDTTVWFGTADLPDFGWAMTTRSPAALTTSGDSLFVFTMCFAPDPANLSHGLTAAADSIYLTLQATNDGGQNISSATENIVANPSSSNGFTRNFLSQLFNVNKPTAVTVSNFLAFKQWRFIIASDLNGRYVLSVKYPKLLR